MKIVLVNSHRKPAMVWLKWRKKTLLDKHKISGFHSIECKMNFPGMEQLQLRSKPPGVVTMHDAEDFKK